jgi:hypothetical protein
MKLILSAIMAYFAPSLFKEQADTKSQTDGATKEDFEAELAKIYENYFDTEYFNPH